MITAEVGLPKTKSAAQERRSLTRVRFAPIVSIIATAAVIIRDVRIWAGAEGTRLVFDLSGAPDYRVESLTNPARVVIDLNDASFPPKPMPPAQGFFQQLRAAPQPGNKLRLVIDLNAAAQARAFLVAPDASRGHRLVLDLKAPATTSAALFGTKLSFQKPIIASRVNARTDDSVPSSV